MESITPVSTNLVQNYQAAQNQGVVTTPSSIEPVQPEIAQNIVSKEAANASKAYAAGIINTQTNENREEIVQPEQAPEEQAPAEQVPTEETSAEQAPAEENNTEETEKQ